MNKWIGSYRILSGLSNSKNYDNFDLELLHVSLELEISRLQWRL